MSMMLLQFISHAKHNNKYSKSPKTKKKRPIAFHQPTRKINHSMIQKRTKRSSSIKKLLASSLLDDDIDWTFGICFAILDSIGYLAHYLFVLNLFRSCGSFAPNSLCRIASVMPNSLHRHRCLPVLVLLSVEVSYY